MKRIAPDIDRLMWTIAETRDMKAAEEFDERFPDLKFELAKRMTLVRSLKTAKKSGSSTIPAFTPKARLTPTPRSMATYAVAGVALVALAFGSYAATANYLAHRQSQPVKQEIKLSSNASGMPNQQSGTQNEMHGVLPPNQRQPDVNRIIDNPVTTNARETDATPLIAAFSFSDIPLQTVLRYLEKEAKLTFEFAPQLPNPNVSVDYHGLTAKQILLDLGHRYDFTPFDEGEGNMLLVHKSAPDSTAGIADQPDSKPNNQ